MKELIDAEGDDELALRVAVRPGGCSGFSYEMFFDSEMPRTTSRRRLRRGQGRGRPDRARSCSTGATLDYKDGLQDAGFAINNPNAQRTCGCGQSFS